jgi:hypothetical protein
METNEIVVYKLMKISLSAGMEEGRDSPRRHGGRGEEKDGERRTRQRRKMEEDGREGRR